MDKTIDRIVKLLAKAEATTPHEAEALQAKAEELMIRHSIELLDIERAQGRAAVKPEEIVTRTRVFEGKSYAKVRMLSALRIAKGMGSQGYYQGARDMRTYTVYVVGFERDVDDALLLIESLDLQAATAMREWWEIERDNHRADGYRAQRMERRAFIEGFGITAADRIRAKRQAVVSEYVGTGTDLALIDRDKQVRTWLSEHVALGRGRPDTNTGSWTSRDAGAAAGARANIGSTSVGGGAAAINA